jgi:hypothetical protein
MQVQVKIDDTIWDEFIKIGEKEENIHQITETALISHINKLKAYKGKKKRDKQNMFHIDIKSEL